MTNPKIEEIRDDDKITPKYPTPSHYPLSICVHELDDKPWFLVSIRRFLFKSGGQIVISMSLEMENVRGTVRCKRN